MTSLWHLHVWELQGEAARAPALRLDHGGELVHGLLDVPVDDEVVVLAPRGNFLARPVEPSHDLDGRVALPLPEARLQLLHGRRHDEDRNGLGISLAQLPRAMGVDVQDHVEPAVERALEGLGRGAVAIAVHFRPLRELVLVAHGQELGLRHEVKVLAVDLARAGRPRRVRDRVEEIGHELAHLVAERGLARPRGSRDYDQGPAPLDQFHLSTRLTAGLLSSRLTASPFGSNCHAYGIDSALASGLRPSARTAGPVSARKSF